MRSLEEYDNLYADIFENHGFSALNRNYDFIKWLLKHLSYKLLYDTDDYLLGQKELVEIFSITYRNKVILVDNAYLISRKKIY